jgi:hypothetical protein
VKSITATITFLEGLTMSVLLECQPGDEVICIQEFHAAPDGDTFSWETSHTFHVGDRVRYVEARQHPHFKDRPNGWLAVVATADGKHYAATQTYFVTEECWRGIEQFFCQASTKA